MSQENVEAVLRGYEAVNQGDVDGAVAFVAPDCEVELPPMLPEADANQGREGLKRVWASWIDSFEHFRMEIEEVIDAGDRVMVMACLRGIGKDSGAEVHTPTFAIIWTVREGQAVRIQALPTRAAGMESLGLNSDE